jgi:glycyl-tRNA synthetase (class II)
MADTELMDKLVSLCRRRGYVSRPSNEIAPGQFTFRTREFKQMKQVRIEEGSVVEYLRERLA